MTSYPYANTAMIPCSRHSPGACVKPQVVIGTLARPIACYNVGPHRYLSLADNSDNFDL